MQNIMRCKEIVLKRDWNGFGGLMFLNIKYLLSCVPCDKIFSAAHYELFHLTFIIIRKMAYCNFCIVLV